MHPALPLADKYVTHPIVDGGLRVAVLQVQGVDDEGLRQQEPVPHPHEGAVKVDQHPLVRVHVHRAGILQSDRRISSVILRKTDFSH